MNCGILYLAFYLTSIGILSGGSGGDHVRFWRGPLLIPGFLFGSGGDHCHLALAVEVRLGPLWSWACCSGLAGTTAIKRLQLRSSGGGRKQDLGMKGALGCAQLRTPFTQRTPFKGNLLRSGESRGGGGTANTKSNNLHLTGRWEKKHCCPNVFKKSCDPLGNNP